MKNSHLDVQVLQILVNAIINDISDAYGNPTSLLLESSLELFGRISSDTKNISCPDIWTMYAQLTVLKKTEVHIEKAAYYLQQAYRAATSNQKWYLSEKTTLNVLTLCRNLAQMHLSGTVDITVAKKKKLLGTAKLSLQSVIKKVKEQDWDNSNIVEQLTNVEKYLTDVTDELQQIKSI